MNILTLRAADLMSSDIKTIDPEASVAEAVATMNRHRIHCLLILPSSPSRGIGVIACKDVIHMLADGGVETLKEIRVSEAMTTPAVTVPSDLCIEDCVNLMRMVGVRTVPVVESNRPVGILSFTDVLKALGQMQSGA
jgi:CBS domain-containing protein